MSTIKLRRNPSRPVYPYHVFGCMAENDCRCERTGYKGPPATSIPDLERKVVEAAVRRREAEKVMFPFSQVPSLSFAQGAPEGQDLLTAFTDEQTAVDALIAAREKVENG